MLATKSVGEEANRAPKMKDLAACFVHRFAKRARTYELSNAGIVWSSAFEHRQIARSTYTRGVRPDVSGHGATTNELAEIVRRGKGKKK